MDLEIWYAYGILQPQSALNDVRITTAHDPRSKKMAHALKEKARVKRVHPMRHS